MAGEVIDGGSAIIEIPTEAVQLPPYQNKTLADFYPTQGAILVDAYHAGNLAGGTPCARPEDLAAIDNLAFDQKGDVWGVIDMSTGLHNGFTEGPTPVPTVINHTSRGDVSTYVGVFGNNWLRHAHSLGTASGRGRPDR